MKSDNSETVSALIAIAILLFGSVSWCVNVYKFAQCDFEPSYKAEVMRGIGIFAPPISVFTAWIDLGE